MKKLTREEYYNMVDGIGLGFEALENVAKEFNVKSLTVENIKYILSSLQKSLFENVQDEAKKE